MERGWPSASTHPGRVLLSTHGIFFRNREDRAPTMAAPQPVDRQTFLAHLRSSGLLSGEQLAAVARDCQDTAHGRPDKPSARAVARALVEQGLLTRFQAEHLLVGKKRFFLGPYRILEL